MGGGRIIPNRFVPQKPGKVQGMTGHMTNTPTFLYLTAGKSLTEISRCQEYAINGQEVEQLESPFGSIFLSILMKVDGCQAYSSCWNFNKFCDTAALITVYFKHPNSF